ncbi:MAG: hypothetical protein ABIB47_04550 [Candidatus Woesearchaeota archaeon]
MTGLENFWTPKRIQTLADELRTRGIPMERTPDCPPLPALCDYEATGERPPDVYEHVKKCGPCVARVARIKEVLKEY